MEPRYFNRKGDEISVTEFLLLRADPDYCVVAYFDDDGVTVSTAWLGLDHSSLIGPVKIFETMAWADGEEIMWRYSTEDNAIAGHKALVRILYPWRRYVNDGQWLIVE